MSRPWRLLRAPALHFVVLGGLLFAGTAAWRVPALPARASDEEILFREALRLGIDRRDPLVRERLRRLARFVDTGQVEDEAALEEEARRLGLDRRDVIIRRHLVQVMELALARGGTGAPSDAELADYVARHAEAFTPPARVRLTHVFVSRDRHASDPARRARTLAARLRGGGVAPTRASGLGDAFAWGAELTLSGAEIDRVLGAGFASRLAVVPAGTWSDPIPSSYGFHLVWVHERVAPAPPALAAVRGRALQGLRAERAAARRAERLATLRARSGS